MGESVWPDWDAPPPALHPDHPSAPLPRLQHAPGRPSSGAQQWAAHLVSGGRPQAVLAPARRAADYDYRGTRWAPAEEPEIPLWLAKRVLAEAGDEAAAIRAAAHSEAAAIRQQATAIRQQAAGIRQRAADEAAAIIAAAERDAAQLSTAARHAMLPAAEPARKAIARPRQYAAMRILATVVAALMLFAVTAGATEVGLHGFRFFVFRAAGTGATPGSGLHEDQGPGQPEAPKAPPATGGSHG